MTEDLHLPRHLLETLAADNNPTHEQPARQHMAGCQACTSRLDQIARARAAYLVAYPAEAFARQVATRAEQSRRREAAAGKNDHAGAGRRRWLVALGGLAVALGAVALYVRPSPPAPDAIRLKGGVTWSVFAQRGTRSWPVSEGETLQPGDRLAFAYTLAQDRTLLLLGIDDAGTIVPYGPQGAPPVRLTRGQGRVPFAIELDARPGHEQLVALLSEIPLDVAAARQALAAAAARARGQNRGLTADDLRLAATEIVTFGFQKP